MREIDYYNYHLPSELIAQHPLQHRSDARLLVVNRQRASLTHAHVRDLPELLQPEDALVLNDTRVIPARLVGYRTRTGGRWSGLFLEARQDGLWRVLSKTRGKLQAGESVTLQDHEGKEAGLLHFLASLGEGTWVAKPASQRPYLELLQQWGRVPLPPYIRQGQMTASDQRAYQTVYAQKPGAVAAPTAGLHFTQALLEVLRQRGLAICPVTLHVGLGTFRPVTAERLQEHAMHAEWGRLPASTVETLVSRRQQGGRIVAVGTTCVRLLESATAGDKLVAWSGETNLFIRPPYRFRAVDALLTNFHLPRSTLLVLVRTFGGDDLMQRAYEEAIRERYRFYSYGDAMLIL